MLDRITDHSETEDYRLVQNVIAELSGIKGEPENWNAIAHTVGLTERQLTDLFRRWCGLSPKSFAQAVALDHAKRLLADRASLLDTAYEVGMSSTSRLYDLFVSYEAMPPGAWASRGEGLDMNWGVAPSPFGDALIFSTPYGVAGIGFVDERRPAEGERHPPRDLNAAFADLSGRWPRASFSRNDADARQIGARIFDPKNWDPKRPVRLVLIGSDFEVKVWEKLIEIPMGTARTYGEIAGDLGKPSASRAVGTAVGRNPISFVVPCHRVVGSTGALTGYHWGVARKRAILGWEYGQTHAE
ncbi:MAG: methylated-DNA--[protein]-cysteine S-methyltransferase [Hyphomicrobiaceae bacterium]|nr:methylated-DNA--[protein]-cysteine S-methyltransferase [Hyphomicrobiaceae bacterium]MCC0023878.1 methylated-DNA--[protein]-cysteine S-methyltransferase [Hyphomicrobiaceae bacterium]